jgi:hypothetical protein
MLALKDETTKVKVLPPDSVVCQRSGCEFVATHLFRSGTVVALCELRIPVKWATDSAEKWATDSGN